MNHWLMLIISIAIPLVIGLAGGYLTYSQIAGWYEKLIKPKWNPPNWIFGPVWTLLYILMGISLYIIWNSGADATLLQPAMGLFFMQLVLNFLWSLFFFNRHEVAIALAGILTLWVIILLTIFTFVPISPLAAWLMVPNIVWVSFASILNFRIWRLNRETK